MWLYEKPTEQAKAFAEKWGYYPHALLYSDYSDEVLRAETWVSKLSTDYDHEGIRYALSEMLDMDVIVVDGKEYAPITNAEIRHNLSPDLEEGFIEYEMLLKSPDDQAEYWAIFVLPADAEPDVQDWDGDQVDRLINN